MMTGMRTRNVVMVATFSLVVAVFTAPHPAAQLSADEGPRSGLGQSFDEQSIALRTALHNDATLKAPLERLIALYREGGRLKELVELYKSHLRQYPADSNAHTVLIRLLIATGDPTALTTTQKVVEQFPDNAFLRHVLFEQLRLRNDRTAIEQLDKAIELETRPSRRMAWLEELIPVAELRDRRDIATKHLKQFAESPVNADQRLSLGRLMNRYRFFELALQVLTGTDATPPSPELMVDLELEAASAESGLDKPDVASERLEKLLKKLTGDYWRRPDIVRRRLALITSPEKRDEIVSAVRKRVKETPQNEAAWLDLAQTLASMQLRREALQTLIDAGERMPNSEVIERRTLEMFDRLRDERGRDEYLNIRIERSPERADLILMRVKSQYLLGRRESADGLFEKLIEPMPANEQVVQVLEMARFLRRSNLATEALTWFKRCLDLDSARVDVRRELAETYLALGQRHRVKEIFKDSVPDEAPVEEVLDLLQFMLQQKLLIEANDLIRNRLKTESGNLDLLVLLINVERRMGRLTQGRTLILKTRELADTGARYRAWLEAAVSFFDEFETTEQFLLDEQERLENERGKWTERQLERRLAFTEVASANDLSDSAAAFLQRDLKDELSTAMRLSIRRKLIDILKEDSSHTDIVEAELNELAEEDPTAISLYSAQLALLHKRLNREDRAVQFLQKVDPSQIQDTTVLSNLLSSFKHRLDYSELMTVILKRLTQLNPGDRSVWEQWLTVLAAKSDEEGLRVELRRLLAGVKELTLDEDTKELLQLYMADSYWRSISRRLQVGSMGTLAEMLPLLDAIERMAGSDQQWLWMTWIRAYALNRLDNEKGRDEAIDELERLITSLSQPTGAEDEPAIEPRVVFPDGVSVSVAQARSLLTESDAKSSAFSVSDSIAVVPPFRARWKWSSGSSVTVIQPVGAGRVLIGDQQGSLTCLDAGTGKTIWELNGVLATGAGPTNSNPNYFNATLPTANSSMPRFQFVLLRSVETEELDRLCVSGPSSVSCYSLKDGRLRWRADVGAVARNAGTEWRPLSATEPGVSIFPQNDDQELLTWDPSQSTLARVDATNGKMLWYSTVSGSTGSRTITNSGACLYEDRLLVYGARTAILDIHTGKVVWSFEPQSLRSFPVSLDAKKAAGLQVATASNPYGSVSSSHQRQINAYVQSNPLVVQQIQMQMQSGLISPIQAQAVLMQYMNGGAANVNPWSFSRQSPMVLSAGAVSWASNARKGVASHARMVDSTLLLFQGGNIQTVDLTIPITGRSLPAQGLFVGMSGKVACMLGTSSTLNLINVKSGTTKTWQPTDILPEPGKIPSSRIQATMQGALVYLTGQRGIQCVNAMSGEALYSVAWPASVQPEYLTAPANTSVNSPYRYSSHYTSSHAYAATQNHPTMTSTLATLHDRTLYTATANDTVVALEGVSVDDR